VTTRRL